MILNTLLSHLTRIIAAINSKISNNLINNEVQISERNSKIQKSYKNLCGSEPSLQNIYLLRKLMFYIKYIYLLVYYMYNILITK